MSGVEAFFSRAGAGAFFSAGAGVDFFSGLDFVTRHFSGSSRAAFSSFRSSPDLAVVVDVEASGWQKKRGGEKERKKRVLIEKTLMLLKTKKILFGKCKK